MRCVKRSSDTQTARVMQVVEHHLGEGHATLAVDLGLEFCINLGFPKTESLIALFRYLEENKAYLGVSVPKRCETLVVHDCKNNA